MWPWGAGIDATLCLGGGERGMSLSDTLWWWEVLTLACMPLRNLCMVLS